MPTKQKASRKLAAAIVLIVIAVAYFAELLRVDSEASWIVGILFIDELIIVALIVAAVAVASFDEARYRTKR